MKIVVSIAPRSMTEALAQMHSLRHSRELVEIRVDHIKNLDMERLLRNPRPRVIITNRHRLEGGLFGGNAGEQVRILSSALSHGAEYVDIEMRWGASRIRSLLRPGASGRLIVSHHDPDKTPKKLFPIFRRLAATPGGILKLVTTANDICDNGRVFELLTRARKDGRQIAAFCMNERGQISRILGAKYGNALTYAALSAEKTTASGQLTAADLKKTYRVHTLDKHTKIFGLVGNPVSHSGGVAFHNSIFARKSLNAVYVNFLVDDLNSFLSAFRDEIAGLSITMPFKKPIIPLLDEIDPVASLLNSVNTVVVRKRRLIGYNTDLPAVRRILEQHAKPRGKRAIVLGTGATARTMAYAAISAGASTTIVGRSEEKARALALKFGCSWAALEHITSLGADIIMNATPVGMRSVPRQTLIPRRFLKRGMTVFDAVYNPPLTPLLRQSREAGCRIIPGTELFNAQARLQSHLFLTVVP
ncbi:MAG TPA: type I 3-dehydroquinate dehydratase [Bacteroidota bacterium]|nr:type I 3-dehydroquinate dehydratase [Bacteroidota bacterium]